MILNGTYLFNKLIGSGLINHEENIQFVSSGKNYSGIRVEGFPEIYYDGDWVYALDKGWFLGEEYRTLTFDNQTVSEEFYNWFISNAMTVDVYTIKKSTLKGMADAIRSKTGTSDSILVADFATKIEEIDTTECDHTFSEKLIGSNGIYWASNDNVSGYDKVVVGVQPSLQLKSVTYTSNGTYTVDNDSSYDGLDNVTVTVDVPNDDCNHSFKTKTITENGTYPASRDNCSGYSEVTVNVNVPAPECLHTEATFTENGEYWAYQVGGGVEGFSKVTVDVPIPAPNISQIAPPAYTANGTYSILCGKQSGIPDDQLIDGYDRIDITVDVPSNNTNIVDENKLSVTIKNSSGYDVTCVYASSPAITDGSTLPYPEFGYFYISSDITSTGIPTNSTMSISTYAGTTIYYFKTNGQSGTITADGLLHYIY